MGYVQINGGGIFDIGVPDFSKVIFSFWFRIPAATIAAAVAQFESAWSVDNGFTDFNMPGMIPLVSYGPTEQYNFDNGSFTFSSQMSRSVIAVYCGNQPFYDDDDRTPKLYCKMQYSSGDGHDPAAFIFGSYNDFFEVGSRTVPANFIGTPIAPTPPGTILVSADHWHHALISFDLSSGCSSVVGGPTFPSTSKFWWAFDDGNRNGTFIGPYAPILYGAGGDNDIVSAWCFAKSNAFAAGALPVVNHNFGIPATDADAARIGLVEMAEFQMYTGICIDTGIEVNRRLFVSRDGFPQDPLTAESGLGQPADVLFHAYQDFISGINRGTAGLFDPTGTITKYTPGPSLGA